MPGLDTASYTAMLDARAPRVTSTATLQHPPTAATRINHCRQHPSGGSARMAAPPKETGTPAATGSPLRQWQDFKFWGVTPRGVCCLTFVTAASRTSGLGAPPLVRGFAERSSVPQR